METNFLKLPLFIAFVTLFMACKKDGTAQISKDKDLPNLSQTIISQYFPSAKIVKTEKKRTPDSDGSIYEIKLDNGFEIEFDANGQVTDIDGNHQKIPDGLIHKSILDYVKAHYPDLFITEVDYELHGYEIELSNGIELHFDLEGNFKYVER